MPRKPDFVLVWWINDEMVDIIETSKLPKTKRKKNDIATLTWTNYETGKDVRDQVKILEFGSKEDLQKICLDKKGNICDNNTKIFNHPIVERKRKLKEYDKSRENNIKNAKSDLEEKIAQQAPLLTIDQPCEDEALQKTCSKKSSPRSKRYKSVKKSNITEEETKTLCRSTNPQKIDHGATESKATISKKTLHSRNTRTRATQKQKKSSFKSTNTQKSHLHVENNPSTSETIEPEKSTNRHTTVKHINPLPELNLQNNSDNNLKKKPSTFTSTLTCRTEETSIGSLSEQSNSLIITKKNDNRSPLHELHPFSISNILAKSPSKCRENAISNIYLPNYQLTNINTNDVQINYSLITPIAPLLPSTYYQQSFQDSLNENTPSEIKSTSSNLPLISPMTETKNYCTTDIFNPELAQSNFNTSDQPWLDQSFTTLSNTNFPTVKPIEPSLDVFVGESDITHSSLTPIGDSADQAFHDISNQSLNNREGTERHKSYSEECCTNNVIDDENSNSSNSDDEDTIDVLHTYFSSEVTDRDVSFIRMVEASQEMMFYSQQKDKPGAESTLQLNHFKEPGENKKRISSKYDIYLPSNIIMSIEKETEIEPGISDWTKLVKLALIHVYGERLSFYTAKGRLSSQPGIDKKIRNAILEWARSRSNNTITKESFVAHINKLIQNRKGAETKWNSNQVTKDNIKFFHNVVKTVEKANEAFKNSLSPSRRPDQISIILINSSSLELPKEFKIADPKTHLKISSNHEIHLPIETAACIMRYSKINGMYQWKQLVKLSLTEIYGKNLKKYSALGIGGFHPGIDPELYEALFEWANSFMDKNEIIEKKNYTKFINLLIANKRKKKKVLQK